MPNLARSLATVLDLLTSLGDLPSEDVLASLGLGRLANLTVPLLIGDLSVAETFDFARALLEQGRPVEAEELILAALSAAASGAAQGAQVRWVTWAQGAQAAVG